MMEPEWRSDVSSRLQVRLPCGPCRRQDFPWPQLYGFIRYVLVICETFR